MSPLLALDDLVAGFRGGFSVGPIDAAFGPGVVHLVGPNGAGKSTLLRTVCGGQPPLRGRVRVAERDPHSAPSARREVAWLPATPDLPGWLTVGEAWRLLAGLRSAAAWDGAPACAELGIDEDLRLDHASAGQRKKAELVAALAGDPRLLLFDELFAPLDAAATLTVCGWIETWRTHRLVVLTGHDAPPMKIDSVWSIA